MEKTETKKHKFGLVGRNISYSFSRKYFTEKFELLGLSDHIYENYDIEDIKDFQTLRNKALRGLNVTIPYKEDVIPFLDQLHPQAAEIGAVNTIKFDGNGLTGFNTDIYGFQKAIEPMLTPAHKAALILGTGGASKAVAFVFNELNIAFRFVSRNPGEEALAYSDLNQDVMEQYSVIVNCTPLGTYPNVEQRPDIPYEFVSSTHLFFDLIYNPEKTRFLLEGEKQGAAISNGLKMLELQAEKAWSIWNS
ncbi:shikimate dehydrogenase family protein [Poritiphilus flavus]|uniref:Shikimate dehydrogenase n=1 Tax=Poritiphilus flavus TaxID=2697053 RepID=A0A6L9E9N6_9FLAO|nr:shikimate dehydrogenase [Poritiphilus flavus]NAS11364.1 shikimate dehydrogenase [Poritiphilus flavus]